MKRSQLFTKTTKTTPNDEVSNSAKLLIRAGYVYKEMAGVYDFALIVKGETMQDIAMFVAKKLSTIDGVLSTGTHFIMRRYKDRGMNLTALGVETDERSQFL
jgi:DNA-binding Lrp family transcriptional regulator